MKIMSVMTVMIMMMMMMSMSMVECRRVAASLTALQMLASVTNATAGSMSLNSLEERGDIPYCDGRFHFNKELVVSLSTGWYAGGGRCGSYVETDHDYTPPCNNNDVDASPAVWKALGISNYNEGSEMNITWSDA
ncbi:hypothetical protein SUGI_0045640 [Cryptomeria japonica]|nr:hypothetical protein SUGI_0045640 [Cryptomeria japonica]